MGRGRTPGWPDPTKLAASDVVTWAGDTNLYRSAADVLRTDDNLSVGAGLVVGTNLDLTATGALSWGGDTNLYRSFANTLRTDGTVSVGGGSHLVGLTHCYAGLQVDGSLSVVGNVGFFGAAAAAKPAITGSRGGNAALASLLTALAGLGLITDNTTA